MRLKAWHCQLLLAAAVLIAYFPAVHAGYCSIDDLKMIASLDNAGPVELRRLFFPGGGGYYYRPLTILSFYFDREAWGTIASFMHLENVLLHLANSLLVFAVARRVAGVFGYVGPGLAFCAALFFALHPLAAEPVCWISGRTDLLAGFFLLATLGLFLAGLERRQPGLFLSGGVALLLACLAKEVAVFALPGLLWCVLVFPDSGVSTWLRVRRRWLGLVTPVLAIAGYFALRHIALARDNGIRTAVEGVAVGSFDLLDMLRIALKVYGFYFMKLLLPWPLNFAIAEVAGWYLLGGGALAGLLVWAALRRDLLGALGILAFCVLAPAILIPFGKMAWTPVAERYMYTSVAIIAPAVVIGVCRWSKGLSIDRHRAGLYVVLLVGLVFFGSTMHRAWIWQENVRLFADTVAKSPEFVPARVELATALTYRGQAAAAESVLREMQNAPGAKSFLGDDINLAQLMAARGDLDQARALLVGQLDASHKKYHDLLQAVLKINDQLLVRATDLETRTSIQQESLRWLHEQQRIRPSAFTLYRIGKQQFALGNHAAAREAFRDALAQEPVGAHYREAAARFIERLDGA